MDCSGCHSEGRVEIENGVSISSLLSGTNITFKVPANMDFSLEDDLETLNTEEDIPEEDIILNDDDYMPTVSLKDIEHKMSNVTEDGKLKKYIIRTGNGRIPEDDAVYVHYFSYANYDTEPFDSTYSRSLTPVKYYLGDGSIYAGFEMAIRTMKVGEISGFLVHPDLAFRALGVPPRIPPNAYIFLQIELIKIDLKKEESKEANEETAITDKRAFEEIYKKVKEQLTFGKKHFSSGSIPYAVKNFRKAENILFSCRLKNDEEEIKWKKLLMKIYLNLAVCYNNNAMKKPALVCTIASEAFNIIPELALSHPKFLFQLGKAKLALNGLNDAKKWFNKALNIFGENDEITKFLKMIEEKERVGQELDAIEEKLSFQNLNEK